MEIIKNELNDSYRLLKNFIDNYSNINAIESAAELMKVSIKNGGKVISCGNGGSMCDAMHFAEELTGKFREERKPLPAIWFLRTSRCKRSYSKSL